jgi:hypothetical protein
MVSDLLTALLILSCLGVSLRATFLLPYSSSETSVDNPTARAITYARSQCFRSLVLARGILSEPYHPFLVSLKE